MARTFAVPLRTEAPRKTAFVRAERVASGLTIPGCFSTGKELASHARFADQKILRLDHEAIGRDQIACREHDEVAGHDSAHGHHPLNAVPHDTASQRQSAFQLLDCC